MVPVHLFQQQSSQLLALSQAVRGLFELSGLNARAADVQEIETQVALTRKVAAEEGVGMVSSSSPSSPRSPQRSPRPTRENGQIIDSPPSLPNDVRAMQSAETSLTSLAEDIRLLQSNVANLRSTSAMGEDFRKLQSEVSNLRVSFAERTGDTATLPALLDDLRHLQNDTRDLRATSGIHESWMQSLSTNVAQARELISEVTRRNSECAEASRTRTKVEIDDLREKLLKHSAEAQEQAQQLRELLAACERDVNNQRAASKRETQDAAAAVEKRSSQLIGELRDQSTAKLTQVTERIEDVSRRLTEVGDVIQRDSCEFQGRLGESTQAWQQKAEAILHDMSTRFSALDAKDKAVAQKWSSDVAELQHGFNAALDAALQEVRQEHAHNSALVTKQLDQLFFTFESGLEKANETQVRKMEIAVQSARDEAHRCSEEVRAATQAAAEAAGAAATQRAERLTAEVRAEATSAVLHNAQSLDELRKVMEAENSALQEELSQLSATVESNHLQEKCFAEEMHSKRCEKMESHVRELWQGIQEISSQLDENTVDFTAKLKQMRDKYTQSFLELHTLVKQHREDASADTCRTTESNRNLRKDLEISHEQLHGELARLQGAFASEALSTSERLLAQKEMIEMVKLNATQELRTNLDLVNACLGKDLQHLRTFAEEEVRSLDQKLQKNHEASQSKVDAVAAALAQARESLDTKMEQMQAALRAMDRMASSAREEATRAKERSGAAESSVQAALTGWKDHDLRAQTAKVDEASRALSSLATGVLRLGQACGLLPATAGTTVEENIDPKGKVIMQLRGPIVSETVQPQDLISWERDGVSLARQVELHWAAWAARDVKVAAHAVPMTLLNALDDKAGLQLVRELQLSVRATDGRVYQGSPISPIDAHSTLVAPPMSAFAIDTRPVQRESPSVQEPPGGSGIEAVRSLKSNGLSWACDAPPAAQLLKDPVVEKQAPMTPKSPRGSTPRASVVAARRHWRDLAEA